MVVGKVLAWRPAELAPVGKVIFEATVRDGDCVLQGGGTLYIATNAHRVFGGNAHDDDQSRED